MIKETLMLRVTQDTQATGLRVGGEIDLSGVLHGQNHGLILQSLFGILLVWRQKVIFIYVIVIKEAVRGLTLAPKAAGFGDGSRRIGSQLGSEDNQALGQTPVSQRSSTQLVPGPILAAT